MKQKVTFVVRKMNVQHTIITGIREQLYYNDYLVLPGFGGFVLKNNPARFFSSQQGLTPPAKLLSFNSQLKQNDGVLLAWLQNKLTCNNAQALAHLEDFTNYCTGVLKARSRLTLAGIGFFYLDFEGNICFEPQADTNFLRDSFGLGPVSLNELQAAPLTRVNKENVFTNRVIGHTDTEMVQPTVTKPRPNYFKLLTPALLVLILFGITSLLVLNTRMNGQLKSSVFGISSASRFETLSYPQLNLIENKAFEKKAYVANADGIATLELGSHKSLPVRVIEKLTVSPDLHSNTNIKIVAKELNNGYEVVLGCFGVLSNAQRMISKLNSKNIGAGISPKKHKGMHVVSLGSYISKEEALLNLQQVKDSFPNAWIKKPF